MSARQLRMESDGFTVAERAAMKERAAELRAEGKKGAKQADALQAVLDKIAAIRLALIVFTSVFSSEFADAVTHSCKAARLRI